MRETRRSPAEVDEGSVGRTVEANVDRYQCVCSEDAEAADNRVASRVFATVSSLRFHAALLKQARPILDLTLMRMSVVSEGCVD